MADSPASEGYEAAEWPKQVYDSLPRWARSASDLRLQAWSITEAGWTGPKLYSFTTGGASYYCTPTEQTTGKHDLPQRPAAPRERGVRESSDGFELVAVFMSDRPGSKG